MSDPSDSMAHLDDAEPEKTVKRKTVTHYPRLDPDSEGPFGNSTIRLVGTL